MGVFCSRPRRTSAEKSRVLYLGDLHGSDGGEDGASLKLNAQLNNGIT